MREPDHRDPRVRNHAAAAIENAGGPKGQGRIGGSGFRDDDEEGQGGQRQECSSACPARSASRKLRA